MKAVVIVLAIAVAVSAKPINRKWEEIGELVQGIRGNVGNAIGEIKQLANAANPQVGQEISTYLDGKTPEALDILEKVNAEIEAQTLTYKQAEKYFNQLETLLNKVKDELRNFVSQLPQNVQVDIKNVLDKNIESIREKKNQIFNLLSIKRIANTPEKWGKIRNLYWGILIDLEETLMTVYTVANDANSEVGVQIGKYLEGKMEEFSPVISMLEAEILEETLTYNQAVTYFTQFEKLLNEVKDDLNNLVFELPQNAQVYIKNHLDKNMESFHEKKNQILILLGTKLPQAVQMKIKTILLDSTKLIKDTPEKWEKIRNLFMEILDDLEKTILAVYTVASDANAEVGMQIAYYIQVKLEEFGPIVENIASGIEAETLTYSQAVTYFTQFETFLHEFNDDLNNFVFEIPQYAQVYIKNRLDKNLESYLEKENQIFILLETKLPQAFQMEIKTILEDSTKLIKEKTHKIFALKY